MVFKVRILSGIVKIVALSFGLATIFSCETRRRIDCLEGFGSPVELSPQKRIEHMYLRAPYGLLIRDTVLISWESSEGKQLSFHSINTGTLLFQCLDMGRGPGEAQHVDDVYIKADSLYASVYPEGLFGYNLDDLMTGRRRVAQSVYAHDGIIASTGITAFSKNEADDENATMYRTASLADSTLLYWCDFPADDPVDYPKADFSKQLAYQGHYFVPENVGKALFVYYYAIGFSVLDLEKLSVDHHFYTYPQVELQYFPTFDVTKVSFVEKHQKGFKSGAACDNCFYLLYEDENVSSGSYILSFDWEGRPMGLYHVDESLACFAVDEDAGILCALDAREDLEGSDVFIYYLR